MKTFGIVVALSLIGVSTAKADPHFYNATANNYKVEATFPNGKVESRDLSGGSSGMSEGYFLFSPSVKAVKVAVLDDTGKSVWTGTAKADDIYMLAPGEKAIQVVYAGVYGGSDGPRTAVFMNITGAPITIDLEGHNGVGANRGIAVGTAFDLKKSVRLDAKESTYSVLAKGKGGEKIDIEGSITPGHYVVIWKNGNGDVRAVELGKIALPKK